jgi:hypothetical protein
MNARQFLATSVLITSGAYAYQAALRQQLGTHHGGVPGEFLGFPVLFSRGQDGVWRIYAL